MLSMFDPGASCNMQAPEQTMGGRLVGEADIRKVPDGAGRCNGSLCKGEVLRGRGEGSLRGKPAAAICAMPPAATAAAIWLAMPPTAVGMVV